METEQKISKGNSSPVKMSCLGTRSTHSMFLLPKPFFRSPGSNTNNNNKLLDFLNNVKFHCLPQANIFIRFLVVAVCFAILIKLFYYVYGFIVACFHEFLCIFTACTALHCPLRTQIDAIENTIPFPSLEAFLDASSLSLSLSHSTMRLRCGNESSVDRSGHM